MDSKDDVDILAERNAKDQRAKIRKDEESEVMTINLYALTTKGRGETDDL